MYHFLPYGITEQTLTDLFRAACGSTPVQAVGENWVDKFVKGHANCDGINQQECIGRLSNEILT